MRLQQREYDRTVAESLKGEWGDVVAILLASRGLTPGSVEKFMDPRMSSIRPPDGLPDFEVAITRISNAVERGERIAIYGDYDCDGCTSTAILTTWLRRHNCTVEAVLANRARGYGFNIDVARDLADRCSLIVVFDCGTCDIDAIEAARYRSDVIVIDHHTVPDSVVDHPATALINPRRSDSRFPFDGLCSAGLALYLTNALTDVRDEIRAIDLVEIASVGTIADVMPLCDENRAIVSAGIRSLQHPKNYGLKVLLHTRKKKTRVDERIISHWIAPHLNAAGRMGDPTPALNLLLATNDIEAMKWAEVLEELNVSRRAEQDRVFAEAMAMVDVRDEAIVVAGDWAGGVVGIVAAKLVDRFQKPAFVGSTRDGIIRGSARAFGDESIYDMLKGADSHLLTFGGHPAAAGFSLSLDNIDDFRKTINTQAPTSSEETLIYDLEISPKECTQKLLSEIQCLRPFGAGNPSPVFMMKGRCKDAKRVGDGSHMKLKLDGIDVIGFGLGDAPTQGEVTVVGTLEENSWMGRKSIQINAQYIGA